MIEVMLPRLTEDFPMTNLSTATRTPLRARMMAGMSARNLGRASQTSHLRACKRFAAWLGRSPKTATPDEERDFQRHLIESGTSICTRNQTMTGGEVPVSRDAAAARFGGGSLQPQGAGESASRAELQ
ncbi:hypothetical protein [Palleronia caenipelagi]|uniref:hypothetical protein n=1 Tax=Palleronia caenipelagi TaxID=2489174 RepID=UPI001FE98B21|nr:hypothetical protein [Palleronia caenipelagi]